MNAVRAMLMAAAVIVSAVLVSIPERAGADGPPPGAVEIFIEDEPDEDVSLGTIPDDPEPAEPEAPPSAPPPQEESQPKTSSPAPVHNPTNPAPPTPRPAAAPAVRVNPQPTPPQEPCKDGKPHDGGKDGVVPASGNTNDDCDHSVAPPPPQPSEISVKPDKPAVKPEPKAKKRTKAVQPVQVVYVQPALANDEINPPRAFYCRGGKFADLIKDQPSWDPAYAGYTPAVNGTCPPGASPPVKVVVLQPPPADAGTSRAGYCYKGRYADLLVNQPSWDPEWAGAVPAVNGRC